jgi:hypothetical protein
MNLKEVEDVDKSKLYPGICMGIMRKTTRSLVRITEMKVEVGTHDLQNMRR